MAALGLKVARERNLPPSSDADEKKPGNPAELRQMPGCLQHH
jgi:hypothetical protein